MLDNWIVAVSLADRGKSDYLACDIYLINTNISSQFKLIG